MSSGITRLATSINLTVHVDTYYDVPIGSSEAEAIHAGPFLAKWPRLLPRRNFQAPFFERDLLIWILEVVVWEDEAAFKHQRGLDHTSDT